MFRRVAIIGGGAAAASLLSELLLRQPPSSLHLDWYTGGDTPARGVAYSTPSTHHLLNVRAASMGLFDAKPRGFLDFAQRGDPTIAGTDFLPRRIYGDYLEAEVAHALELARANGHDVRIVPRQVDALVPEHDGITVIHGEENLRVDAAVLAIGALPARPLAGVDDEVLASGRYVTDPWHWLAASASEPAPREVLLIGLGLTAADVLLELAARWPQTRFTAISRHGHWPEAHLPIVATPDGDGTELVEAMHDDPDIRHWLRLLREAVAPARDWRPIIDSLRPHIPGLWGGLSGEQRARFLRHARWAWERVRHRVAPASATALAALEQQGRLQRQRGRMQSTHRIDGRVQLTLAATSVQPTRTLATDLVIQTIGMDNDVRRTTHPLVRQLVTNRHVTPDPLGLGWQSSQDGHLRRPTGEEWPHLFAIGSLLRGTLWESTAMPEIRQQARNIATQLLAD